MRPVTSLNSTSAKYELELDPELESRVNRDPVVAVHSACASHADRAQVAEL